MSPLNPWLVRAACGLTVALTINSAFNPTWAAVVWDESLNGDFSDNRLAPTSIPTLSVGTNSVLGAIGESIGQSDLDYYTINVPQNAVLSALILADYQSLDEISFVGVQAGTRMTVPTTTGTAAGLLGWLHFGPSGSAGVGDDLLPGMGSGAFSADGFTPPLPSGPYTFWVQAFDGFPVDYQFDFVVTPLSTNPLPGDYNGNHVVDAADYTVWRDTLGQTVALGSGADGHADGTITQDDYTFWKSRFGNVLPSPGGGSAVPEPISVWLLLWGLPLVALWRYAR
jgi:hypothetical protein